VIRRESADRQRKPNAGSLRIEPFEGRRSRFAADVAVSSGKRGLSGTLDACRPLVADAPLYSQYRLLFRTYRDRWPRVAFQKKRSFTHYRYRQFSMSPVFRYESVFSRQVGHVGQESLS
jgi:hypothetical protein